MKNILFLLVTVVTAASLYGQERQIFIPGYDKEPDDEPVELFPPYETVFSGRELPRTFTISYPDEESALCGSLAPSLYLQPMDAAPQVADGGSHYDYTWIYKMPFAWVGRLVILYIGSADNPYTVLINGHQAGSNQSSRSAAEFDITSLSKEGVNTLTVRVEKNPEVSLLTASKGDGKITGSVLIKSQPRIRVRDYVVQANLTADEPTLQLGVILKTDMLNPRTVTIHYALRDREGITVASGYREAEVGLKAEDTVRFFTPIKDLRAWTYETPHLYDLTIKNQYEGRYTEYVNYKVGFNNIYMQDGNLWTDGYRIPLAFYVSSTSTDTQSPGEILSEIKRQGYNMVIVRDYPADKNFMSACDSIGLYVCNQADINTSASGDSRAEGGNPSNDPRWADSFTDRAVTMHGTSSNHASAAMFSIARSSSNGYNLYESYLATKSVERTRPVIYPESNGEWDSDAVTALFSTAHPEAVEGRLVLDLENPARIYPEGNRLYAEIQTDSDGTCHVFNRAQVTRLRGTIHYTIKKGVKKIAEGSVPVTVEPGGEVTVVIPVPDNGAGKKLKFETRLSSNFDGFTPGMN